MGGPLILIVYLIVAIVATVIRKIAEEQAKQQAKQSQTNYDSAEIEQFNLASEQEELADFRITTSEYQDEVYDIEEQEQEEIVGRQDLPLETSIHSMDREKLQRRFNLKEAIVMSELVRSPRAKRPWPHR